MSPERLPPWLRKDLAPGHEAARTDALLKEWGLHTICESGRCPNRDECYSQRTATFMILGDVCTRRCGFCSVSTGRPEPLDEKEPARLAQAVRRLGLQHVVVTSVNRDDLPDEGASHFVEVIRQVRQVSDGIVVEILTPDFRRTQGEAVAGIVEAGPDIFNHNAETVPRLYRRVRPQGDYEATLRVFRRVRHSASANPPQSTVDESPPQGVGGSVRTGPPRFVADAGALWRIRGQGRRVLTKSGLMLGLGEERGEVLQVMRDLKEAGCDMLTLGQYLRSSALGLPVEEHVHPDVFASYEEEARRIGFEWVESGPFVRSSYHAKQSFESLQAALETRRG